MMQFFDLMPGLLVAFWIVGIVSGFIFLLQTLMTFTGGADADGLNADFDGDFHGVDAPFQMFTLRNLVNFLLGFGWSGVVLYKGIENKIFLVIIATLIGLVFVALFFLVIKQVLRLNEDNTFNIQGLIHASGEAYTPIPQHMQGKGKVQISYRGSTHELDAMTEGESIASGTSVKVQSIKDNLLIVQKIA